MGISLRFYDSNLWDNECFPIPPSYSCCCLSNPYMRYIFCKSHKVNRLLMLQLENLCEQAFLMCLIVIPWRYFRIIALSVAVYLQLLPFQFCDTVAVFKLYLQLLPFQFCDKVAVFKLWQRIYEKAKFSWFLSSSSFSPPLLNHWLQISKIFLKGL